MDVENLVIQLCIQGTQAEFMKEILRAGALYQQAWDCATNDYEACIAAHYLARCQGNPAERLRWNQEALARADAVGSAMVREFYPSLYLSLGQSFEECGDQEQAQRYYTLAADLGFPHQPESGG